MSRKKTEIAFSTYVLLALSFGLAVLDMFLLRDAFKELMGFNIAYSSIIAVIVALVADSVALSWGKINGEKLAKRAVNKHSLFYFLFWVALGLVYAMIRLAYFFRSNGDVMGQAIQFAVLAISYIFSGIEIQRSARQIWDADIIEYRAAKKNFEIMHRKLAEENAILQNKLEILRDYDQNYESLDKQYEDIKLNIMHGEEAVMADIEGKTLDENPDITPEKVNEVKKMVLKEREEANEKLHNKQKEVRYK